MTLRNLCLILIIPACTFCSREDFLDNYDKQSLFAQPTQEELDAVISDWESRDLSPANYNIEQVHEVSSDGALLKIVSFYVSGYKEYGAFLTRNDETKSPVRMWVGGFSKENPITVIHLAEDNNPGGGIPFIFAIPALRGQSLKITVNGNEYSTPVSEGQHCDAFDGATDDAIAFLNVIEKIEPNADINRVSVRGGSRGATVAFLMAERDKRVKLAVGVAGPANLIPLTATHENDPTYQCQFLDELVNGSASITEVRHKMIASSPLFFAEKLPETQFHLAAEDKIVPVSQGNELKTKIDATGHDILELYIYPGRNHSNIATNNQELEERIEEFLSQL